MHPLAATACRACGVQIVCSESAWTTLLGSEK